MLTALCKVIIGLGKSAIKKPNNISNKYFITSILSSPPHITRGKTDKIEVIKYLLLMFFGFLIADLPSPIVTLQSSVSISYCYSI